MYCNRLGQARASLIQSKRHPAWHLKVSAMTKQEKMSQIPGDPFYALEKLESAVYLMAVSRGNIKERLILALYEIAPVSAADFPDHLGTEFVEIVEALTKSQAKTERVYRGGRFVEESTGTLLPTMRYMRYSRATEIAKRIYELTIKLSGYLTSQQD